MTNKQRKSKNKKKWIGWLVLLVLLIIAMVATFLVWNENFRRDETGQIIEEKTVEEVETTDNDEANETNVAMDEEDYETGGKKIAQYEGGNPNKAAELSGVITYAGAVGENLMIRTNIDQFLGEGSCSLMILRDGTTVYSETVAIVAEASTSSCQGFDVPLAVIGNGTAQININLNSGGKTGVLTTEVNL